MNPTEELANAVVNLINGARQLLEKHVNTTTGMTDEEKTKLENLTKEVNEVVANINSVLNPPLSVVEPVNPTTTVAGSEPEPYKPA